MNTFTLKRYTDLALLGVFAYAIWHVILSHIANTKFVQAYVKYVNDLSDIGRFTFGLVAGAVTYVILNNTGVIHQSRLFHNTWHYPKLNNWRFSDLHYWCYPGVSAASYIALACFVFSDLKGFSLLFDFNNNELFAYILVGFLLGYAHPVAFLLIQEFETEKDGEPDNKPENRSFSLDNIGDGILEEWLKTEEPVTRYDQFWFSRDEMVDRLVDRIRNSDTPQQIALVADYGTGKSTVTNMVCRSLFDKPKNDSSDKTKNDIQWLTITIGNWGRDPHGVSAIILNSLLNKVSTVADVSHVNRLPEHYRNAIKAKGGWFTVFMELATKTDRLFQNELGHLNSLLKLKNTKILMVFEDADRNAEPEVLLNQIANLLEELKKFSQFSAIINIGDNPSVINTINRVCTFKEDLNQESYIEIFKRFMAIWIKRAEDTLEKEPDERVYLPLRKGSSKTKNIKVGDYLRNRWEGGTVYKPLDYLIHGPRIAKQICRRVDEIWQPERLLGEIDLIDLLVLQTIRELFPEYYHSIKINHSKVGKMGIAHNADEASKENKIYQEFIDFLPGSKEPDNKYLLSLLITVFSKNDSFQRLGFESAAESYFYRFEREKKLINLEDGELYDQSLIRLIMKFSRDPKKENGSNLISFILAKNKNVDIFHNFAKEFWAKQYEQKKTNKHYSKLASALMKYLKAPENKDRAMELWRDGSYSPTLQRFFSLLADKLITEPTLPRLIDLYLEVMQLLITQYPGVLTNHYKSYWKHESWNNKWHEAKKRCNKILSESIENKPNQILTAIETDKLYDIIMYWSGSFEKEDGCQYDVRNASTIKLLTLFLKMIQNNENDERTRYSIKLIHDAMAYWSHGSIEDIEVEKKMKRWLEFPDDFVREVIKTFIDLEGALAPLPAEKTDSARVFYQVIGRFRRANQLFN